MPKHGHAPGYLGYAEPLDLKAGTFASLARQIRPMLR
jgi:hypothetical protein